MSDYSITLRIGADGKAAIAGIEQVKASVGSVGQASTQAGKQGEAAAASWGGALREVDRMLATVAKTALAMGAAAGATLLAMGRSAINAADEAAKLSQRLGVAVEDISALRLAAELGGSNIQELGMGLQQLARRADDAARGSKTAAESFESAGIRVTDTNGRLRPMMELLGDLAERFSTMPDGPEKTALAMDMLGRSGAALIPTLNGGRAGLAQVRIEAEALGLVLDTETAKAAEHFNDNITRLQRGVQGLALDMAKELLPTLIEVTDAAVAWFKEVREDGTLARWGENLRTVLGLLDEIAVFLLGRWVAAKAAAAAATLGFGAALNALPLVAITTAVGLLAVGVYKLVSANREMQPVLDASRRAIEEVNRATGDGTRVSEESRQRLLDEAQERLGVARAAAAEARAIYEANQAKSVGNLGIGAGLGAAVRGDESVRQLEADLESLTEALARNSEAKGTAAVASAQMEQADTRARVSAADMAAAKRAEAQAIRDAEAARRELEQAAQASYAAYMAQLQVLDPLLAMELQHAAALKELASWYAMGVITAEQYAERKAMAVQISQAAISAYNAERDVIGQTVAQMRGQITVMRMGAKEAFVHAAAQETIREHIRMGLPVREENIKLIKQEAAELYEATQSMNAVNEIMAQFGDDAVQNPISQLVDGVAKVREEIVRLKEEIEDMPDGMEKAFKTEQLEEYERAVARVNVAIAQNMVGATAQALRGIQSMTEEGSNSYRNLGIAVEALTAAQAILGIVNQSGGDPYTAFARMAAMAAIMAQFVGNVAGQFGGGFTDTAAQRQATQGTGTVLGDAEAKSESIANAIQITADATSELVGINRGMLNALIALQGGIDNATGMLARGAGRVEFDQMVIQPLRHAFLGSVFTPMLRFLSGSSQITDRGIMIGGGGVGNLNPQAYQEEQYRTWRFGSRRTREQTAALPGNVAAQFDLIMQSIVDTVREAATALGLVPEDIEAAIAAYEVEVTRISLSDLSAEEQQAELEAVFSAIFDGLAGSVVPFVEQFQRVGEGLGETLVRVATGAQVTQEAVRRLGFALDETDPERFAQISEGLIEMSGGLEGFIAGMSSFLDKFAPESHRFAVAQDELTRAFEQAGLTVPATRDAMWELMQSLDATTEEGREQIATLLRLADVADEYYRLLERRGSLDEILMRSLRGDWSGPIQELQALNAEYQEAMANAAALGASEAELGMIRGYFTRQSLRLAAQLMESAMQLAQQLGYITGLTPDSPGQTEIGAIGDVTAAVEDRYARELQLLQQLDQFIRSLSTSALSPLSPRQRMSAARQEYERLLALAQGGDLDALGQLQGAAQTYLQQAQGFYGGVGEYEGIFNAVQSSLQALVNAGPQSQQIGPQTPVFGGPVTVEPGEGWAAQNAIERAMLAQQLVDHLAALSIALNTPVLELMETLGIPITQLAADLGVEISNLTGQAVETLAQLAYDLGLPLGELVQALGLNLPDLADGLRELTDQLGIDLNDLSAETAGQLAALAGNLRTDLTTLTTALGIDLGRLTDVNSPIFQALEQTLDSLSPAIRDQLQPHLEAVRNATTEADANAAIDLLRDVVGDLPVGIRAQLAPILGTPYPGALTEVDYLEDIDVSMSALLTYIDGPNGTNSILRDIFQRLGQQGGTSASYAVGTSYVPHDMMAQIHQGEMILPAPVADFVRREGLLSAANDSAGLIAEVRALRNDLAALRKERADDAKAQRDAQQVAGDAMLRTARAAEVANEIRRTG